MLVDRGQSRSAAEPDSLRFRHRQVRVELLACPEGLAEVRPVLLRDHLVEGWWVYGQVVMEDGRFRSFSWIPRLQPDRARPFCPPKDTPLAP